VSSYWKSVFDVDAFLIWSNRSLTQMNADRKIMSTKKWARAKEYRSHRIGVTFFFKVDRGIMLWYCIYLMSVLSESKLHGCATRRTIISWSSFCMNSHQSVSQEAPPELNWERYITTGTHCPYVTMVIRNKYLLDHNCPKVREQMFLSFSLHTSEHGMR